MKKSKYNHIMEVLVAFDQLGNAIAGGYADQTVSGRVGWHANYGGHRANWRIPEMVIDWGFDPVDGFGHCLKSIEGDRAISDHTTFGLVSVTALAVAFAVPIGLLLRLRAGFIFCREYLMNQFER